MRTKTAKIAIAAAVGLPGLASGPARADFGGVPTTFKVDGGWCWFQDPRAIINNGHLIFGSVAGTTVAGVATGGDENATDFNFATGITTSNTLAAAYDQDDHASPAFAVLPDNRILVTYESHGGSNNVLWRVSTNPGDGTSWGPQQTSIVNTANDGNGNTYNNPFYLSVDNMVYDFSRAIGYDTNYSEFTGLNSTNNSALNNAANFQYGGHALYWQNPNTGALTGGNGRPYVKYASNGTNRIWLATTEDSPQNYIDSLYGGYAQFNASGGGTIFTSAGVALGGISTGTAPTGSVNPPTAGGNQGSYASGTGFSYNPTQLTPIIKANTNLNGLDLSSASPYGAGYANWASSMQLDSTGNPYLGIVVSRNLNGGYGNDLEYDYAHLVAGAWQVFRVGYAGFPLYNGQNQYAGLMAVDPLDPNKIYISDDVNPTTNAAILGPDGKQHWEIFAGVTTTGGSTWNWTQLTNTSSDNIRPVVAAGSGSEALLWMQGSYTSFTDYNMNIVGLLQSSSGTVVTSGISKANTAILNTAADWVGGIAPTAGDIALFDSTISAGNAANLISTTNLSWSGITITAANGPIVIASTHPFTLTLGSAGINMGSATQNLTINSNLAIASATNQIWNIAAGQTLTLSTGNFTRGSGAALNIQGTGTVTSTMPGLANDASENGGILGAWATVGSGISTTYAALSGGNIVPYTFLAGSTGSSTIPQTVTAATNYKITTAGNITFGAATRALNTLTNAAGASTLTFGNSPSLIQLVANGILNDGTATLTIARGGSNVSSGVQIGPTRELVLNAAAGGIAISAPIADNTAGASGLTIIASNSVTFSGANTFTGPTIITAGIVVASNPAALGTTAGGTTVASGATLDLLAAVGNESLTIAGTGFTGNGALMTDSGTASLAGPVILSANAGIGGAGNLSLTGAITGGFALTKVGSGNITLSGSNNYSGATVVTAGTLTFASASAFPLNSSLNVSAGLVSFANHGASAVYVPRLSTLANTGSIDLTNNAMVIHNGSIGSVTNQVARGSIISSIAAADSTHLTAVGVATGFTTFEGLTVSATDVLLKYTYLGDANLDGKVDGSDYSRIDTGYLNNLTGWYNGDFNYDGMVNGSDYTLIDNTFNTQGAAITDQNAAIASQISSSGIASVPEPTLLALGLTGASVVLRRRRVRSVETVAPVVESARHA